MLRQLALLSCWILIPSAAAATQFFGPLESGLPDVFAVAEDGSGGYFVAGFTSGQLGAAHVTKTGQLSWGPGEILGNVELTSVFYGAYSLAAVADGLGGVFVALAFRDHGTDQRGFVIEHFNQFGATTLLGPQELAQPSISFYRARLVAGPAGSAVLVGLPTAASEDGFTLVVPSTTQPITSPFEQPLGLGTHDFIFDVDGDGQGGVFVAWGMSGDARALYRNNNGTDVWGAGGTTINPQLPATVLDRRIRYDSATGDVYTFWGLDNANVYGQALDLGNGSGLWTTGGELLLSCTPFDNSISAGLEVVLDRDGGFVLLAGQGDACIQAFQEDGIARWASAAQISKGGYSATASDLYAFMDQRLVMLDDAVGITTYGYFPFFAIGVVWGSVIDLGTGQFQSTHFEVTPEQDPNAFSAFGRPVWVDEPGADIFNAAYVTYDGQGGYAVEVTDLYPKVFLASPTSAAQNAFISVTLEGWGFQQPWDLWLEQNGSPSIPVENLEVIPDGQGPAGRGVITGEADLTDAPFGEWAFVLRDPNDQSLAHVYENNVFVDRLTITGPFFLENSGGDLSSAPPAVGATWLDANGDGVEEFYLSRVGNNQLLEGVSGGGWADITSGPLGDSGNGVGAVTADYDCDGDFDLYVVNYLGSNRLLQNDGSGNFSDITPPDLALTGGSVFANWVDYDNDGDGDLYVAQLDEPNHLFRNDGNSFTDVTPAVLSDSGPTTSVSWSDFDKDGDPDAYLCRYQQPNLLVRNEGGGNFVDITGPTAAVAGGSTGCDWGDFDGDGWMDLYVANDDGADVLLRNVSDGGGRNLEAFTPLPLGFEGKSLSPSFKDWDFDGDEDLLLTVLDETTVTYTNNGNGNYTEQTLGAINSATPGRGVAWRSGIDPSVIITSTVGENQCFVVFSTGFYIAFTNLTLGTRVEVDALGRTQVQEFQAGAGYTGQDSPGRLVFGLGEFIQYADEVRIYWPTGEVYTYANMLAGDWIIPRPEPDLFADITAGDLAQSLVGRGVAWVDFDNDGRLDITAATAGSGMKLFRNAAPDQFLENFPIGPTGPTNADALVWRDLDGDGQTDAFVLGESFDESSLLQTIVPSLYADITATSLPSLNTVAANAASWIDYDQDGVLDLYVGVSARNLLYLGQSNGTFLPGNVDGGAGETPTNNCSDVDWVDLNGDGDLDVFLANPTGANQIYRNDGGGAYTDVTTPTVAGLDVTRSVDLGDYDNDGDFDVYVGNSDGTNYLLRNEGGFVFSDATSGPLGGSDATWHVSWVDFNNDGNLDLYVGNQGPDRLLRNDGGGNFTDVSPAGLLPSADTHAAGWGDYDDDGDLDGLISTNQGLRLLRNLNSEGGTLNKQVASHWLQVVLNSPTSFDAPVGARVELTVGGMTLTRSVSATASQSGSDARRLSFGLGPATVVDAMTIEWPNGTTTQETNVAVDQLLTRTEPPPTGVQGLPTVVSLRTYPNPAPGQSVFSFDLPKPGPVSIHVYDVAGRRVRTLAEGVEYPAGKHSLPWAGVDNRGAAVSSGVYFVQLKTENGVRGKSLLVVR